MRIKRLTFDLECPVCGNPFRGLRWCLLSGHTKSCGCLRLLPKTHGLYKSPEHNSWGSMCQRVRNPNHIDYKNYGGRGITICERWSKFENFLADMGKRPSGTSIDRINNDGNYEPGNCRWATRKQQNNNRRDNRGVLA